MTATAHSSNGRIPPQDIDAEKSLLGAMLLSDAALPEILTIIKPQDFYDERHGKIFKGMVALYDKQKPIDLLTLTAELRTEKTLKEVGGAPYLTELTNFVPTASHAKAYAEIIEKNSLRRRLINAGTKIAEQAYNDDAEVNDLIGDAEKDLFEVSDKSIKSDYTALEDLVTDAYDRLENLHKNKGALRGLKTGFPDIDKMTGGFQKGNLIILGARPAMGKTSLGVNFAYNVASINKCGVLLFSLEMSKAEIVDRIVSDASNVDNWKIRNGNVTDDDFAKIGDALSEISELPIYIDDTSGITATELRNKARRAAHDHNIGLIIIDYLTLLSGGDRYKGNRVQEVTEISRSLKTLARELDVPVIALAQLSRNVTGREDPRPVLSDLRESGSIEQDADLVMFLHRPDYYHQNEDDYEPTNITELLISKYRHGKTGKIKLFFREALTRFESVDHDHAEE